MQENQGKGKLILLAVVLVLVIGGAAILYPCLSRQADEETPMQDETVIAEVTVAPDATVIPERSSEPAASQPTPEGNESPAPEATAQVQGPVMKHMAADFTVYDAEGNAVKLSDMRGKPVVVNFFASWCGPCKMEMPYFEQCFAEYGEDVQFMMVNLCAFGNDTREAADKMVADGGYTFPVYYDTDGEATTAYAIRSMPMTLFVAADGELIGRKTGMVQEEALIATVQSLVQQD